MQKINKGNPPAFFSDFIKKSKPKDWNDIAPIREQLRKYILENEPFIPRIQDYCA